MDIPTHIYTCQLKNKICGNEVRQREAQFKEKKIQGSLTSLMCGRCSNIIRALKLLRWRKHIKVMQQFE